jgi:predicted dehydrogenase
MNLIKVAIIGFGGIARFHYAAYANLKKADSLLKLLRCVKKIPKAFSRR